MKACKNRKEEQGCSKKRKNNVTKKGRNLKKLNLMMIKMKMRILQREVIQVTMIDLILQVHQYQKGSQ